MTEDMGVAATPPGHSNEPASSLAADAGSVPNADTFTIDAAYLRREASEAFRSYFSPLMWPVRLGRWLWADAGRLLFVVMALLTLIPLVGIIQALYALGE